MSLRIYSGDERMALELSMDSPHADIHAKENRASSDQAIKIRGENFEITGVGWSWLGNEKEVRVLSETKVVFQQGMGDSLGDPDTSSADTTLIYSGSLLLRTTDDGYFLSLIGTFWCSRGIWSSAVSV